MKKRLKIFLAGRLSYLNPQGDRNTFARPYHEKLHVFKPYFVNVVLTNFQEQEIKKCFETYARLKYDPMDGTWSQTPKEKPRTLPSSSFASQRSPRKQTTRKPKNQSDVERMLDEMELTYKKIHLSVTTMTTKIKLWSKVKS